MSVVYDTILQFTTQSRYFLSSTMIISTHRIKRVKIKEDELSKIKERKIVSFENKII